MNVSEILHRNQLSQCRLCRISVNDLSVSREGDTLLSHVSLHVHCGRLTALVGPNGAGKTTLIRALLGQLGYAGRVEHQDAQGHRIGTIRTGYVPQHFPFDRQMPVTVEDLMASLIAKRPVWLGVSEKTRAHIREQLTLAHGESLLKRRLGALSGGEMQRVLLALALDPLPDLLILDEPVSGVDQNGQGIFLELVEELVHNYHLAVLLVTHDWALVRRYADDVVLLDKTVRAEGSPDEVFASEAFAELFPAVRADTV